MWINTDYLELFAGQTVGLALVMTSLVLLQGTILGTVIVFTSLVAFIVLSVLMCIYGAVFWGKTTKRIGLFLSGLMVAMGLASVAWAMFSEESFYNFMGVVAITFMLAAVFRDSVLEKL